MHLFGQSNQFVDYFLGVRPSFLGHFDCLPLLGGEELVNAGKLRRAGPKDGSFLSQSIEIGTGKLPTRKDERDGGMPAAEFVVYCRAALLDESAESWNGWSWKTDCGSCSWWWGLASA